MLAFNATSNKCIGLNKCKFKIVQWITYVVNFQMKSSGNSESNLKFCVQVRFEFRHPSKPLGNTINSSKVIPWSSCNVVLQSSDKNNNLSLSPRPAISESWKTIGINTHTHIYVNRRLWLNCQSLSLSLSLYSQTYIHTHARAHTHI